MIINVNTEVQTTSWDGNTLDEVKAKPAVVFSQQWF